MTKNDLETAVGRVDDFERWRKREVAQTWETLGNFYDGQQWEPGAPQYAVTANDTLANIDIKCRALAFDDPEPVVRALDGPNEEGERIWEGVLRASYRYCNANKEIKKVIRLTNVLGIAATHVYWDEASGWPKLKAIDPRTLAFDPEMEDWDSPEWVAICRYIPKYELVRQFGEQAKSLAPDVVRRRSETEGPSTAPKQASQGVERVKVWEYWQNEKRLHAIWAEQKPTQPLLLHEVSDTDERGPDPTFPSELVIPVRFLTAVPAINSLLPHSYVKLGLETQIRLNEALTAMVQAFKRIVPSMITRKGTFDASEKRKMMEGEIGEIYEVSDEVAALADAIQNMPNPTLNAALYPLLDRLERQLHVYGNVTEYHQGVQVSSRTTATEAQGRMRFSGIRGRGEEQDLREHIAACFHMMRAMWLYYAPDTVVRYEDREGRSRFQPMDRMSLGGIGGPQLDFPAYIAVRESSTLRKDSVLEQQSAIQLFQMLIGATPALANVGVQVNIKKLLDDLLRSFSVSDIEAYYSQQAEPSIPMDIGLDKIAQGRYNNFGGPATGQVTEAGLLPDQTGEMGF